MRFIAVVLITVFLASCGGNSMNKILKNPDPEYKLKIAEQYFVKKKYSKAQSIFEDIMPYYRTVPNQFENIYYKYAIAPITRKTI